jgi:3-mercaptopyruvate sulfurtransferase SseA
MRVFAWLLALAVSLAAVTAQGRSRPVWWQDAEIQAAHDGYVLADHKDLPRLAGAGALFLDVRPGYEFADGHMPGAVSLEFDLGDRQELGAQKREELLSLLGADKARPVVVYCRSFR